MDMGMGMCMGMGMSMGMGMDMHTYRWGGAARVGNAELVFTLHPSRLTPHTHTYRFHRWGQPAWAMLSWWPVCSTGVQTSTQR